MIEVIIAIIRERAMTKQIKNVAGTSKYHSCQQISYKYIFP